MLRLLVWLVLLWVALRALRQLVGGITQGMSGQPPKAVGLVRDPVCGTFVVPSRALSSGAGENVQYFCSERCRKAWASR